MELICKLTSLYVYYAGINDSQMFSIYFESFLFIHIYIFTKSFNSTSIQEKQSEFQKRGKFLNQTHTPTTKKIRNTLSHYAKSNTQLYVYTHTPTHTQPCTKCKHPKLQPHAARRLTNRNVNSTKHTRRITLMCNISNTHPL